MMASMFIFSEAARTRGFDMGLLDFHSHFRGRRWCSSWRSGCSPASDTKQDVIRRRMEAVRKAERRGDVSLGLKLVRDEMLSSVPSLHRLMLHWSWSVRLQEYIAQAGLTMKAGKLVLLSGVVWVWAPTCSSDVFYPQFPIAAYLRIGVLAAPFLVIAYVGGGARDACGSLKSTFPKLWICLGRAVRAGHAFTTGLEMIAKESSEPIAGEFRTTFDEQNFGLPLRDALLNMTERIPLIDVRFFVTALLIQKETGGNLAEILDGLARVIRDRFRIYREVKVRTAQGRLDGRHPDCPADFHDDRADRSLNPSLHEGAIR